MIEDSPRYERLAWTTNAQIKMHSNRKHVIKLIGIFIF